MDTAAVLLSGGMYSATLLRYVRERLGVAEVHALSFYYGQKHARELDAARHQAESAGVASHRLVDLSFFADLIAGASALTRGGATVPDLSDLVDAARLQPSTYVPNRNMVLLALAAAYAEGHGVRDVFYGAQAQDEYGYWDCTVDFVRGINDVLGLNRRNAVTVHAPFAGRSKADVLRIGLELGVDYAQTWSCYRGEARPCGTCPSCAERKKAFCALGIEDPLARLT